MAMKLFVIVTSSTIDLANLLKIYNPSQRVRYELQEIGQPTLADILKMKFQK